MRATSAFVRLFVRGLAWDAEDGGKTFDETLKAAARAKLTATASGKVLVGTGSGGTTVQFALPPLGDLTAADVTEVTSRLLDMVDTLRAATPDILDAALVSALLAAFPSIRTVRPDFSADCR